VHEIGIQAKYDDLGRAQGFPEPDRVPEFWLIPFAEDA
jgi:hypothetical protein